MGKTAKKSFGQRACTVNLATSDSHEWQKQTGTRLWHILGMQRQRADSLLLTYCPVPSSGITVILPQLASYLAGCTLRLSVLCLLSTQYAWSSGGC